MTRRLITAPLVLALTLFAAASAQAAPAAWEASVTLGNGAVLTGAGKGAAVPTSPIVLAASSGRADAAIVDAQLCMAGSLDPAKVTGKIVVCDRGGNVLVNKSLEVRNAGGVGVVIANTPASPAPLAEDHIIPTVHVNDTVGAAIKAYVAGTPNAVASLQAGQRVFAPSTTTLTSSANPSLAGQLVTFTATVSAGSLQPTGTVAFTDGGTAISGCESVALSATAQAICSTSALGAGAHQIKAEYSGDDGLAGSSATLSQQVNAPPANRAPKTKPDVYFAKRNVTLTISAPGVLGNDSDSNGDALTVTRVLGPAFGTLTLRADGSFVYTPRKNFTGFDGFIYKVSDGRGGTALGVVAITVRR
jgi:Bacterial Ig domain/PA domain